MQLRAYLAVLAAFASLLLALPALADPERTPQPTRSSLEAGDALGRALFAEPGRRERAARRARAVREAREAGLESGTFPRHALRVSVRRAGPSLPETWLRQWGDVERHPRP